MLDYKGNLGLQYNPNAIAQLALGYYDGIIVVRTRSIGKSYNKILSRIDAFPGIELLHSFMIYKDWESPS